MFNDMPRKRLDANHSSESSIRKNNDTRGGTERMETQRSQSCEHAERNNRTADDTSSRRFEQAYRDVVRANERAGRAGESRAKKAESKPAKPQEADRGLAVNESGEERLQAMNEYVTAIESMPVDELEGISPEGKLVAEGPTTQAQKIIRETLSLVAETFGLNLAGELDELQLSEPSEATVKQFGEILVSMKGIAKLLVDATEKGVALQVNGATLEPEQMVSLEKRVRVQMFRMEVALGQIGLAGKLSQMMADNKQMPQIGGIPVAVDPTSLSMPQSQISQVFGELVSSTEEQIKSVVARIAALAEQRQGTVSVKAESLTVQVQTQQSVRATGEPGAFDSQVLRRLLNIDGEGKPVVEAGAQGGEQEEKPSMPGVQVSGLSLSQMRQMREMLEMPTQRGEETGAQGLQARVTGVMPGLENAARTTPSAYRTLEQSVMEQVQDRLNGIVRTSGTTQVRLLLRPESLGEVQLRVQVDGDVVMAKITVENQQVKQIIESNMQMLRNALSENNLQAGSFDVNVNQGSQEQAGQMAEGKRADRIGSDEDEQEDMEMHVRGPELGKDTGRRYGNNSMEYYA
jgi:flagellar hook-length control protein FliK